MSPRTYLITLGAGLFLTATASAFEPSSPPKNVESTQANASAVSHPRALRHIRHTPSTVEFSPSRQPMVVATQSEAASCCVGKGGNVNCSGIIDLGDLSALVN